jgi:hypothetical protein
MSHGGYLDLYLTGFWLGLTQVGLGFHLLASQGAGALFYFATLALWLGGSVAGTFHRGSTTFGRGLLLVVTVAYLPTALIARWAPFTGWSLIAGLLSVALAGAFAGWFLQDRVALSSSGVAATLFHENNGFLAGYAVAAMLLLLWIPALDGLACAMGLLLTVAAPTQPASTLSEGANHRRP